ncbi:glycosyl hydrolase family protein with chitinaseinsertion domain [Striga asiatica]|uniref:Glycosyl hydrolase family protein with chitinaseinsertion domain n=1 Tax=Striga asiatica TaxID=4170 RepID=A0A5A7P6I1_STRAF|nr:glycosyl hydrolase family protein with chitinaseinsertion domain [Striga asiatica]
MNKGKEKSNPKSPGIFEERDECAVDVASHDRLDSSHILPADKNRRNHLLPPAAAGEAEEEGVDLCSGGVAVKLDDGRTHAKAKEQLLDHMAHAAATNGEHHHGVPADEEADLLQRRVHVHRRRRQVPGGDRRRRRLHVLGYLHFCDGRVV